MEEALGVDLGEPVISTQDVNYYHYETTAGIKLVIIFDAGDICFEIRLDLDRNREKGFMVSLPGAIRAVERGIRLDVLIDILRELDIEWAFDSKKTYLQTVCLLLKSGIRLYYAFGERQNEDYGFFSIRSVLEGHKFN